MGSGLSYNNPTIVSAFHSALVDQGLIALALLGAVLVVWSLLRARQLRSLAAGESLQPLPVVPEPVGRRFLRIVFGCIWVFDGFLQAQPAMPLGMIPEVVRPTAASSPSWVQHLVNAGGTIWSYHPVTAAASAVWIQVGIGLLLIVAPRGIWSRLAGGASIAWGLVVWIFGESFGGIFAPGSSLLFGTPGAVLFYCAAGVLIALPERTFANARTGRIALQVMGVFLLGMALLQAWPSGGFWQNGVQSPVASMSSSMATTPQPAAFASAVNACGSFVASNAFAVNFVVVAALAVIGLFFLSGRPRLCRYGFYAAIVFALADWFFIQDMGFFGGVGTDPNSMLPLLAFTTGGYLALTRPAPEVVAAPVLEPIGATGTIGWLGRQARERPAFLLRAAAGLAAVGIVLLGSVPMAMASLNPNADQIVARATDGSPDALDSRAAPFSLIDQYGHRLSLANLRGRTVVITFLDPVCTSDCPLIAQELRSLDDSLGQQRKKLAIVAIVANPLYRSVSALSAFDHTEGMARLSNWYYLTGSLQQLQKTWNSYGVQVATESAGTMVAHSEILYVIDKRGNTRYALDSDPGPGTAASKSSFTVLLMSSVEHLLAAK